MGGTLARAFEGGGGLMGAVQSLGAQAGGTLMSHIGGALSAAGPWGALASAALPLAAALGRRIWGAITGMFGGGTNAAEDAYEQVSEAAQGAAQEDQQLQAHMTQAFTDGLDERAAAVRAFFLTVGMAQGQTWADADAEFQRFHAAQLDSASRAEQEWAAARAQKLQDEYIAMQAQVDENAAAADTMREDWSSTFSAQTVENDAATDAAIANIGRLRDAWIGDDGIGGMQDATANFLGALHGGGTGGLFGKITDWAIGGFQAMLESWQEILHAMQESMALASANIAETAAEITASVESIPSHKTITITTVYQTVGTPAGQLPAGGNGGGSDVAKALAGMEFRLGDDLDRVVMERMPATAERVL